MKKDCDACREAVDVALEKKLVKILEQFCKKHPDFFVIGDSITLTLHGIGGKKNGTGN